MQTVWTVQVLWDDVPAALDLLERDHVGLWQPRPLGNRVVIDCDDKKDAALITSAFVHAKLLDAET